MHPDESRPRYRAFISYSHRDRAWADWLHRTIEAWRPPRALVGRVTAQGPVPERLSPLFRDRDELPASADLSRVITEALERSAHLIVICSPAAAASRWVNEEILAFKRLHGEERIFALIVEGDPDSDDPAVACFPPALRFQLGADGALSGETLEPAAADARDSGDGRANARLKLIAGLLGVGLGELTQREAIAQRRRLRLTQALAAILALLAAAAIWFAISAQRERSRAEANLQAGIGAAQTMIFDIAQKSATAVGAQRSVLVGILKQADDLLARLSDGQTLTLQGRRSAAAAQHELADALLRAGDGEGALVAAERSLSLIAAEVEAAPQDARLKRELSVSHEKRGDARAALDDDVGALEDYRRSLALRAALAPEGADAEARFDLAIAHSKLATHLLMLGDIPSAFQNYEAQLHIDRELMEAEPDNAAYIRDVAIALDGLARCRLAQGDLETALKVQQDVVEIRRNLVTHAPDSAEARRDLAIAHRQLGHAHMAGDAYPAALEAYEAALAIFASLSAADPSDVETIYDLAMVRLDIGDLMGRQGSFGAAALRYTLALAALEEVVRTDPATSRYAAGLATANAWLGGIRAHEQNYAEAETLLLRALALREQLVAARPANRLRRYERAVAHFALGAFEGQRGDVAGSIAWFEKAEAELAELVAERPDSAYSDLLEMIRSQLAHLREPPR